jgi:hypothetical protein
MMRLILAPKSMEGIKDSKLTDEKSGKNTLKMIKEKMTHTTWRRDSRAKISYIERIKHLQGVEIATTFSHSLEDWRDLSLALGVLIIGKIMTKLPLWPNTMKSVKLR